MSVGPKYGFTNFPGSHFRPDSADIQAYSLLQVISGKDPDICWVSGSLNSTGGLRNLLRIELYRVSQLEAWSLSLPAADRGFASCCHGSYLQFIVLWDYEECLWCA